MKKCVRIFISLNELKLENSITQNVKIKSDVDEVLFNICHDKNFINKVFDLHFLDEDDLECNTLNIFRDTFGLEPLFNLRTYPYLYYCFINIEPTHENIAVLYNKLGINVQLLLLAMWFVKDNSVNFRYILPYYEVSESNLGFPRAFYHYSIPVFSNGEQKDIEFTSSELKEVGKWCKLIFGFVKSAEVDKYENGRAVFGTMPNIPSYQRAINFMLSVRSDWNITSKIAGFISILECILSVKGENTHKVSERVAWFIGKDSEERKKIYKTIKSAYNDRSNYIHGSTIKHDNNSKKKRELMIIDLDEIVRRVLKKCFKDYPYLNYGANKRDNLALFEEVDEWFNELVITGETPKEIKIESN